MIEIYHAVNQALRLRWKSSWWTFQLKICDLRPSIAAKKSSKIRTKRRFQISCLEKVVDPYISRTPTQSSVVMTTKYFVGTRYFALRHKWPLRDIPLWKKKISRDLLDINWSHEDKSIRELVRNLKGITLRNCLTSLLPLFLDLLKENTPLPVKTWKIIFKFWWKAKLFSQIFFVRFVEQRECFFLRKLTDRKNLRVLDMDQYLVTDCLNCQPF